MTVDELHTVSRTMFRNARLTVDLFRDQVWVGNCVLEGNEIIDCYAIQLGVSGPESDEILAAIMQAIQAGQTSLNWRGQEFSWKLAAPRS